MSWLNKAFIIIIIIITDIFNVFIFHAITHGSIIIIKVRFDQMDTSYLISGGGNEEVESLHSHN